MLLRIKGLIPSDKLAIVREILDSAHFVDGKLSAGKEAVNVKNNEELPQNHPEMARLNNIVMGQLVSHPVYKSIRCTASQNSRPFLCALYTG